jgi:hypothetical protein
MDDAKCVVFSEATKDGGRLYFIGMQDDETRDFVDIPLVADRWSWESGRRDRFLLGTNPDGTPRFLEAYHLRPDEQVEDVLDMVFLPQMCVAHSNRNRAKYEVIT